MDKLTMGDRIKEVRKKQKLTQEQLAERLGVSVEFVGQIERGIKLPSMISRFCHECCHKARCTRTCSGLLQGSEPG